jgi:hypothetical protein
VRVAISQPTYLPWMGYFDLIDQVDLFVILDNVQFTKQSWQHRNRIKTGAGLQWLTVPVTFRGRFGQLIQEVEIRDPDFCKKHIRAIELAYRRTPYFDHHFPAVKNTLEHSSRGLLVDLNLEFIYLFIAMLGMQTRIVKSSNLFQSGKRTQLLANICEAVGASEYVSPLGSADYLLTEERLMKERGIEVFFQNYDHPIYAQLFPPFEPYASVVDVLFNEGGKALEILRRGRRANISARQLGLSIQLA